MIYYIEFRNGYCGLSQEPKRTILRRHGTENVGSISPATAEQIDYVRAMGGYVPERAIKKATGEQ